MSETHYTAVRAFHTAIEADCPAVPTLPRPDVAALRRTLLREEYTELMQALDAGDLATIAQEAVDLLYVTYGLCVAYGIDADAVFAEVQRANMAKTRGPRRADGKQLKPDDWTPPDVRGVLQRQRLRRSGEQSASTADVHIDLIFDGGADPNPGQGYGSYQIVVNDELQTIQRLTFGEKITNNVAEYTTLLTALQAINRDFADLTHVTLTIKGDSQLVIKQISREWKARDERMAALRDQVLELLQPFAEWTAQWHARSNSVDVLGH